MKTFPNEDLSSLINWIEENGGNSNSKNIDILKTSEGWKLMTQCDVKKKFFYYNYT